MKNSNPKASFMEASDIEEAARNSDAVAKSSPLAAYLSQEASQVIAEIEDIYFGGATFDAKRGVMVANNTHRDELIDWIKSAGVDPAVLSGAIKLMKPGEVMLIKDRAFVKTPTQEFQEAGAYINRVEKTLLSHMHKNRDLEAKVKALEEDIRDRVEVLEHIAEDRDTIKQLVVRLFRLIFRGK